MMNKYGISIFLVLLFGLTGVYGQLAPGMPGGMEQEYPADKDSLAAASAVRSAVRAKAQQLNVAITQFNVIKYTKQYVAGINYFIKIKIGNGRNSYVHARVYQRLPVYGGGYSLDGLEVNHTQQDRIAYVNQFREQNERPVG